MSDTTQEWTPEARKIREAERAAALKALRGGIEYVGAEQIVDALFPPHPPEYTYGNPVHDPVAPDVPTVRRSDGEWGFWGPGGRWETLQHTDGYFRACAAEVPLSDAERAYLLEVHTANRHLSNRQQFETLRFAFTRVLRGEVK